MLPALDSKIKTLNQDIAAVNADIRRFLKHHMIAVDGRISFKADTATARARLARLLRGREDKRDALMRERTLALTERTAAQSRRALP